MLGVELSGQEPSGETCGLEICDIESCFARGIDYSSGHDVEINMIEAHKWFNIAASRGHKDGAQMRREIAALMSDAEIGQAQRAARDWLKMHPLPAVQNPQLEPLRVAA
jgi:TPR repeat protein